jgi:hypothetical protein
MAKTYNRRVNREQQRQVRELRNTPGATTLQRARNLRRAQQNEAAGAAWAGRQKRGTINPYARR